MMFQKPRRWPRPTPLQIALSRSGRNWFHKRLVPHNDYLRGVSR